MLIRVRKCLCSHKRHIYGTVLAKFEKRGTQSALITSETFLYFAILFPSCKESNL
jgi:hypothetical protein